MSLEQSDVPDEEVVDYRFTDAPSVTVVSDKS